MHVLDMSKCLLGSRKGLLGRFARAGAQRGLCTQMDERFARVRSVKAKASGRLINAACPDSGNLLPFWAPYARVLSTVLSSGARKAVL